MNGTTHVKNDNCGRMQSSEGKGKDSEWSCSGRGKDFCFCRLGCTSVPRLQPIPLKTGSNQLDKSLGSQEIPLRIALPENVYSWMFKGIMLSMQFVCSRQLSQLGKLTGLSVKNNFIWIDNLAKIKNKRCNFETKTRLDCWAKEEVGKNWVYGYLIILTFHRILPQILVEWHFHSFYIFLHIQLSVYHLFV